MSCRFILAIAYLLAAPALAQTYPAGVFKGGTLTSELVCAIEGVEFQETDTITDCSGFAATGGGIFFDDSEGVLKKCEDNVLSVLDTTGGSFTDIDTDYGAETVTSAWTMDLLTLGGLMSASAGTDVIIQPPTGQRFQINEAAGAGEEVTIGPDGFGTFEITLSTDMTGYTFRSDNGNQWGDLAPETGKLKLNGPSGLDAQVNSLSGAILFTTANDPDSGFDCDGSDSCSIEAGGESAFPISNDGTSTLAKAVCDSTQAGGSECFRVETSAAGHLFGVDTSGANVTGDFAASGFVDLSVTAGITASATQTQAGGTALTTQVNQITTVATSGNAVTMITAEAGREQEIFNDGANTLQIFPAVDDDLGNGVDVSLDLGANERITFSAINSTLWDIMSETQVPHAEMEDLTKNTTPFAISAANNAEVYHSAGVTAGDLAEWTFDAGGGGNVKSITTVADDGGGNILVTTSATHGLAVGAIISQANLSDPNYEGVFQVVTVPSTTTYTVTATWGVTDTGTMQEAATLTANPSAAGVYAIKGAVSAVAETNNDVFDFQIRIDAAIQGASFRQKFAAGADYRSFPVSLGTVTVAAGDKVSLDITNTVGAGDITLFSIAILLTRL